MQYSEFIKHVQERAGVSSRDEAESIIRATIETLADRLSDGEPANLAAQLPEPIKGYLTAPGVAETTYKYSVDEFIAKVAERASIEPSQAEACAQAVLQVLGEAVSPGEMHDVRVRFPPEYTRLFGERDERQVSA